MTFVGSTANDAGLNAWITDSTDTRNRASAESILAILPFAATGAVLGLGGLLVTGDDKAGRYALFFFTLGAVVALCGLIGLFTLRDAPKTKKSEGNYFSNLIYSLRPSIIRDNYKLYFTLLAVAIYSIAAQVFFPYLIIYLQHSPDRFFDLSHLALTPGLLIAAVLVILAAVAGILCSGRQHVPLCRPGCRVRAGPPCRHPHERRLPPRSPAKRNAINKKRGRPFGRPLFSWKEISEGQRTAQHKSRAVPRQMGHCPHRKSILSCEAQINRGAREWT